MYSQQGLLTSAALAPPECCSLGASRWSIPSTVQLEDIQYCQRTIKQGARRVSESKAVRIQPHLEHLHIQ